MRVFYAIEPEVAGGFGKNTITIRTPGTPVVVQKLHYQFDGWVGDEILETTPCFIVTKRMADAIQKAGLTGVEFDDVEITTSKLFDEYYPEKKLPEFLWLKVVGVSRRDDFGLADDLRLVVSDDALEVLKSIGFSNASSISKV